MAQALASNIFRLQLVRGARPWRAVVPQRARLPNALLALPDPLQHDEWALPHPSGRPSLQRSTDSVRVRSQGRSARAWGQRVGYNAQCLTWSSQGSWRERGSGHMILPGAPQLSSFRNAVSANGEGAKGVPILPITPSNAAASTARAPLRRRSRAAIYAAMITKHPLHPCRRCFSGRRNLPYALPSRHLGFRRLFLARARVGWGGAWGVGRGGACAQMMMGTQEEGHQVSQRRRAREVSGLRLLFGAWPAAAQRTQRL